MNRFIVVPVSAWILSTVLMTTTANCEEPRAVTAKDPADPAELAQLVGGNTTFGLELYSRLRQLPGNKFLSPFSLSTALAMTAAGARGETARQLNDVLHIPATPERAERAFATLLATLKGGASGARPAYELHTANALWGERSYHFLPAFVATLHDHYGATLEEVDFRNASDTARQTINNWVEKQTAGKIQDLIASGALDASTRLVLTNAVYFKGNWTSPFRAGQTQQEDFHLADRRTVRVPMMHQTGGFGYFEDDLLQALELPYVGGDLAMVVLLPRAVDGLAAVERSLTATSLTARLQKLQHREVAVALPRFKLTDEFELSRVLGTLGMTLPFSDRADFSGMNGGGEPLQISAVIHKAYVDVNETGTEAAAATAVGIRATMALPQAPAPFRADHPFLFLIRDRRTGSLLFLGSLTQPEK